jgi:hypothetical protein
MDRNYELRLSDSVRCCDIQMLIKFGAGIQETFRLLLQQFVGCSVGITEE